MTSDQLGVEVRARSNSPLLADGYSFGLGFTARTQTGHAPVAGSTGDFSWGGAFGTYFWVDPKEEMAVVFMAAAPSESCTHFRTLTKNFVLASIIDCYRALAANERTRLPSAQLPEHWST